MKNLQDKIFSIISLAIIFSLFAYLPYAYFANKKSNAEALGNNVLYRDFTGERFNKFKSEINHFETDILNMVMNRFPGYDNIVSGLSGIDSKLDMLLFSSSIGYMPLKLKDNILYYDDIKNKRYCRFLAFPQKSDIATEYYNRYYDVAKSANPAVKMSIFAVPMTWQVPSGEKKLSPYDEFKTFFAFSSNLKSEISTSILNVPDASLHKQYFFKTDHHWSIRGAYAGYLQICRLLNIDNPIKVSNFQKLKNVKFRGSVARTLLSDKYYDEFEYIDMDAVVPSNSYIIKVNGAVPPKEFSLKSEYLLHDGHNEISERRTSDSQSIYDNIYGNFHHMDVGLIEYDFTPGSMNHAVANRLGNLLIIGDSLSNCIEPLIASHFTKTYVVDQRMYGHENPNWLASFVKEKKITDILILSSTNGLYISFPENIGVRQVTEK